MQEQRIKVRIKGLRPYLQHRFVMEDQKGTKKKKKTYDPKEEAEKAAYRNKEGMLYIPARQVEAAMIKAAVDFKYEGKKSYKEIIKAACFIEPQEIKINPQKYEIDEAAVVIQRSRILRWRPRFDNWSAEFELTSIDPNLDIEVALEILKSAGRFKGIGDDRPRYGRFEIEVIK